MVSYNAGLPRVAEDELLRAEQPGVKWAERKMRA